MLFCQSGLKTSKQLNIQKIPLGLITERLFLFKAVDNFVDITKILKKANKTK